MNNEVEDIELDIEGLIDFLEETSKISRGIKK